MNSGKPTLILGASTNPYRISFEAVLRLKSRNEKVYLIGRNKGEIQGIPIHTKIEDWNDVHTVSIYLNKDNQLEYYDSLLALKPQRVIFNPGAENFEFYKLLQDAGIEVENACTLVLLGTSQY
jgi:predicted CoA-binding protein